MQLQVTNPRATATATITGEGYSFDVTVGQEADTAEIITTIQGAYRLENQRRAQAQEAPIPVPEAKTIEDLIPSLRAFKGLAEQTLNIE